MAEILWHRRETRRETENTNFTPETLEGLSLLDKYSVDAQLLASWAEPQLRPVCRNSPGLEACQFGSRSIPCYDASWVKPRVILWGFVLNCSPLHPETVCRMSDCPPPLSNVLPYQREHVRVFAPFPHSSAPTRRMADRLGLNNGDQ